MQLLLGIFATLTDFNPPRLCNGYGRSGGVTLSVQKKLESKAG
jgi:hypothetical protein